MSLIPESPRNRRAGIWFHSMAAWPGLQLFADRRNSSVWLNPASEKYSEGLVPVREAEATKQASVLPIRHSAVRGQRPLPPGYARIVWRGADELSQSYDLTLTTLDIRRIVNSLHD